jgi:cation-transporting ATPase E
MNSLKFEKDSTMEQITGLSRAEVEARTQAGQVNQAVDNEFKTNKQIIKENTFTYFNLIFLVLAILLIIVGSFRDLSFLPVIIANTVIGIVQEIRAKKVLGKLQVLHATKAQALRDGKLTTVPVNQLVLGDVIVLKTGEQIPADAEVLSGEVRVNESLLTGESDEIAKTAGDELMSGSFIVSGQVYAKLTKVGADSYIAKLTLKAKSMGSGEQSEMVRSINKLIKWVGIIIIPLGLALFGQSFFINHASFKESITSMEAAIIGMIPEGLYLLTTIALALAAMRLAKNQVMLHDMKSVETLARVDVFCVDKTGTITEHKMAVEKLIPVGQYTAETAKVVLTNLQRNLPADNETSQAIAKFVGDGEFQQADHLIPFTSVNKYSGCVVGQQTLLMGAPEFLLRDQFPRYQAQVDQFAQDGMRVLLVGQTSQLLADEKTPLTQAVEPVAFVLIANPIRKEAPDTFAYFAKQGVQIKVISGDNPETVARIAQKANIAHAENYVDASTLAPEDYPAAVKKYTVFGRVKPEQKRAFVKALQDQGRTVAMTGDGVNDILAMKEADCSIAVASGNSAAVQASQVVLLDSNFARMPKVVDEGRRVVNNIERSASLFLVKNIFSLLMAVFALVLTITYPLRPSQITLISAFTIGMPSFLLALESNHRRIRGKFIPSILARSIPGGVSDMLAVSVLVIADQVITIGQKDVATTATILLVLVGMMVLYHISAPLNKFRTAVLLLSVLCIILSIIFLPNFFQLSAISKTALFLLIVLFLAAASVFRWLTLICDSVREVIFVWEEKGKNTTFGDLKAAWKLGRQTRQG